MPELCLQITAEIPSLCLNPSFQPLLISLYCSFLCYLPCCLPGGYQVDTDVCDSNEDGVYQLSPISLHKGSVCSQTAGAAEESIALKRLSCFPSPKSSFQALAFCAKQPSRLQNCLVSTKTFPRKQFFLRSLIWLQKHQFSRLHNYLASKVSLRPLPFLKKKSSRH